MPTTAFQGCFADSSTAPAFPKKITMSPFNIGFALLGVCQLLAVKNNAVYFAMQGMDCFYGPANTTFAKYGASTSCTSKCGADTSVSGPNCGGVNANSVYKLVVSIHHYLLT